MSVTVTLHEENRHQTKEVTDPVLLAAIDYVCVKIDSAVTNPSSMAVVSFAVVLLLLGEGLCYAHGKFEARESPSLLQRMERMESLLLEQDAKLTSQGNLLLRQEQKLASQENLLQVQAHQISSQENLLRRQNAKISRQDRQLREHESSLSRQDKVNSQQNDLLTRLAGKLHRVNTPLKDQTISGVHNRHRSTDTYLFKDHNVTKDISNHQTSHYKTSHHDVSARADDTDPLEAVVGQLSQRVTEMGADLHTLRTTVTQQDHDIQDAASSAFIHWGSSQCSNASQLVYSGVVGGSHYTSTGAASNYLCLTMSPVFSDQQVRPGYIASLYGTEYQTFDSHNDKDAVCAVCRSTYSTTVMIPGTNVCTEGWRLQYSGFLMAGRDIHPAASEHICVDSRLENSVHGDQNEDGAVLYYIVTRCGSLPCTPYVNNKVVTCAVCSK